ncbi:MAG: CDP-alcohol phosphatidyltransferase family protein [Inquilinus sp.]|nr:CDP-alcohol phosphatidyltransferase family protein [Inquilinus sp.]
MFDPAMRRIIEGPLDRVGRWLALAGLSANAVTVGGFAIGGGAAVALAFQHYWLALALILLNRVADGLDGAIARHAGITDLGGYLDIVLDFLFYSGAVFGFAVGRPDQALAAAFLIFSFVGTGSAFLAYAVMAAKRALTTEIRGRKSLYYIGGLAEGTETIAAFVALCLFPDWFAWIAYGFGAACWLTTLARILAAVQEFGE